MDTEKEEELSWAKNEMQNLLAEVNSCMLATVSPQGKPLSSYAPFYRDDAGDYFVYVSGMAKHYAYLKKSGLASLSVIEDEAGASELFARKRLTVDCQASLVNRGSEDWENKMKGMEQRHGSTLSYLRDLVDFDLFRLRPSSGRLVLGFGKAYQVSGDGLSEVAFLGAGGHRSKN